MSADWTVGVCSCMDDMGLCCDVFWCYPCMQGRISSAFSGLPDHMDVGTCCGCICCGYPPCRCFFNYNKRTAIASKYGLKQNCMLDCLVSLFCDPCVVCQHHTELSAHGVPPGHTCCAPSNPPSPPINTMGAPAYHTIGAPPQGPYQAPPQGSYQPAQ